MASIKRRKVELSSYTCQHPGDIDGMCIKCGKKLDNADDPSRVSLGYIYKNFRVSSVALRKFKSDYSKDMLRQKKLCLVLDLDHTLLNSCFFPNITPHEKECFKQALPDALFRLDHLKIMTKLRPFVRTFLKEANELFDIFIYTMGNRNYALQMATLLDPYDIYFHSRVISKDDSIDKSRKDLDLVFVQEKAVIVVDDTARAWEKHPRNLVEIERYDYFAWSCRRSDLDRKSFSEERCDERESDGPLACVLEVLKGVHSLFFDEENKLDLGDRDVREVLKKFKEKSDPLL